MRRLTMAFLYCLLLCFRSTVQQKAVAAWNIRSTLTLYPKLAKSCLSVTVIFSPEICTKVCEIFQSDLYNRTVSNGWRRFHEIWVLRWVSDGCPFLHQISGWPQILWSVNIFSFRKLGLVWLVRSRIYPSLPEYWCVSCSTTLKVP